MDITKLYVGQEIKNYIVLCEILGEPVKAGNTKTLQLKNFQRYFTWRKEGHKFIITEIYAVPLEKEDKRREGNHSIYMEDIEQILLQYLSEQVEYVKSMTNKEWYQDLGMVNNKYFMYRKNEKEKLLELHSDMQLKFIKEFYRRSSEKIRYTFFSALGNFQKRGLIDYEEELYIVEKDNKEHLADEDEKRQVEEVESHVLVEVLGLKQKKEVFLKFKEEEYYRETKKRVSELYGWKGYYKKTRVVYLKGNIHESINRDIILKHKQSLAEKIIDALNKQALSFYEKNVRENHEKYWGTFNEMIVRNEKIWVYPQSYVPMQEILADELIGEGYDSQKQYTELIIDDNGDMDEAW